MPVTLVGGLFLQARCDLAGDHVGSQFHRTSREMGVRTVVWTWSGQELADHRQSMPGCNGDGSKCGPKYCGSDILQASTGGDAIPAKHGQDRPLDETAIGPKLIRRQHRLYR